MKQLYKNAIMEAIDCCEDVDLLDLVWRLLQDAAGGPMPSNVMTLEVKPDADHSRDTRKHGAVPVQICRRTSHPDQVHPKMGNRREQLSGVCGGTDSISRAA